ncbi:MAG: hypothetical protein IPK59_13285 [Rhodospirillaceae bacterium]|nr:hypothetical protein [Rhodospirillaceae bacterium]
MIEFADAFGTTPHRRSLIRNLVQYRTLLATDGYLHGIQFVDGSFVENVETNRGRPPGDIDVLSLLEAPAKYHPSNADWDSNWQNTGEAFWKSEVVNRPVNKARFLLDTYAMIVTEMPLEGFLDNVIYWYSLFSHQRDTFAWKGFVRIALNTDEDAEVLERLRDA